MNIGVGDHQVSNYTAETMARTVGARIHTPIVYDGRWPGVDVGWDIPAIDATRSPARPRLLGRRPVRTTRLADRGSRHRRAADPEHPEPQRRGPAQLPAGHAGGAADGLRLPAAERGSNITDTCAGAPCYSYGFTGP